MSKESDYGISKIEDLLYYIDGSINTLQDHLEDIRNHLSDIEDEIASIEETKNE